MVYMNKENFYKTVRIEFGDLIGKDKDYFWVRMREPKTRLMTNYQKMLTSLAKTDALKDVKKENLEKMGEEEKIKYASTKLDSQLSVTEQLIGWLEEHFVEIYEESNVYHNEKESATAEEVREILFGSFAMSSRLLNDYTVFVNGDK